MSVLGAILEVIYTIGDPFYLHVFTKSKHQAFPYHPPTTQSRLLSEFPVSLSPLPLTGFARPSPSLACSSPPLLPWLQVWTQIIPQGGWTEDKPPENPTFFLPGWIPKVPT